MADLSLEWRDDIQVSASGDLLLSDGDDLARQRIIRRVMTAVQSYIFELGYGAGLPQKIGEALSVTAIQAIVRSQMLLEVAVSQTPPPVVTAVQSGSNLGLVVIGISYTDAASGSTVSFSFSV